MTTLAPSFQYDILRSCTVKTCLKRPLKKNTKIGFLHHWPFWNILLTVPRRYFFCGSFMFLFCLIFAMSLCASVYMCFEVTCWEKADLLVLVCGVCCEFVTFPLVSWVRCGTWLHRFLIFAPLLTFNTDYCLMQVKSIAECSKGSILQYFRPSLSYHFVLRPLYCLFLSGSIRQVLLYSGRPYNLRWVWTSGRSDQELRS